MKIKTVIYQQELLGKIPPQDFKTIKNLNPDHVCLPEYFFHPDFIAYKDSMKLMKEYSEELNCTLIGGSTVLEENGKFYNTCYIFHKGKEKGSYKKINLFFREQGKITPGSEFFTYKFNAINIGLMICADALSETAWNKMAGLNPDIVYIPTFSPYKEETKEEKFKRDEELYVAGAKKCGCPVVKVCCIGQFKDTKLQGRSLVADPNGILWRVEPENENDKIIKKIEIEV